MSETIFVSLSVYERPFWWAYESGCLWNEGKTEKLQMRRMIVLCTIWKRKIVHNFLKRLQNEILIRDHTRASSWGSSPALRVIAFTRNHKEGWFLSFRTSSVFSRQVFSCFVVLSETLKECLRPLDRLLEYRMPTVSAWPLVSYYICWLLTLDVTDVEGKIAEHT